MTIIDSKMMTFAYILLCFVCWNFPEAYYTMPISANNSRLTSPFDQWFDQKLDHDSEDTIMWKQKYRLNMDYYNYDGLAFLMIGGEYYEPGDSWNNDWMDYYCARFNAVCFQLEHRFYGESHPTVDLSTENLKYLSTRQVLADISNFITTMKAKLNFPDNTKWILFGASYGGTVAALAKAYYPNLIHAVVSSSSPLIAVIDFEDYYKDVQYQIETYYGEQCLNNIKQANHMIDNLLNTVEGRIEIESKIILCSPILMDNVKDKNVLFSQLATIFGNLIQFNDESLNAINIRTICDIMNNNATENVLDRFADVVNVYNIANNRRCTYASHDWMINFWSQTTWVGNTPVGFRQWLYQTCTEWGFFSTSNHEDSFFNNYIPVDYFVNVCTEVFGPMFDLESLTRGVGQTNDMLTYLQGHSEKIIFVQGMRDPWSVLGIDYINLIKAIAVIIPEASHCADTIPPHDNESPEIEDARLQIQNTLHAWVV